MPHGARRYLSILVDFLKLGALYWLTIYPRVRRELLCWRARARGIPDRTLRRQALAALREKRRHAEGAAAFAVIAPRSERRQVIRFLVAFQVMYDYLDTISEEPGPDTLANTRQLHVALTDALMPGIAQSPAYALHSHHEDGDYLTDLVDACQATCSALPAFAIVAPLVQPAARLAIDSQGYNHALPTAPPDFLSEVVAPWAAREGGDTHNLTWWEVIGVTGSSLAILALVAAAANPSFDRSESAAIHDVYVPWAGAVLALIDSVVDQARDDAEDSHSLVARYPSAEVAADRVAAFVERALALTARTKCPEHHALIISAMIALFASEPEAKAPFARQAIQSALGAAGACGVLPFAAIRARRRLSR